MFCVMECKSIMYHVLCNGMLVYYVSCFVQWNGSLLCIMFCVMEWKSIMYHVLCNGM